MTRDAAEREVARLQREHPERGTHTWMARRASDGWEVVRLALPGPARVDPVVATTEARPRPPQADDPRSAPFRNVPPLGGGI